MPIQSKSTILDFLKANGPHLDVEIAAALKIPLGKVRNEVADLSSTGELICCDTVRFTDGARIEGISCRLSCYTPPAARGRKPGVKKAATTESFAD
jgi:hypothetical protein